ncbi:unnamed protein product [Pleuronectes platessa]|uniref:Uncharacterized protein n=1 Tax=Pleuronectes platessa TaxID=8262 RepID=A0A9N7VD23_PLEPL|nr:unnamed protein product [Pleuronectes platessa]
MPFSYNPFAGYPGMGYGMVMPSFPPPPYMDPSAYLLPQPHMQAVDYRRLLHPQVHAPSAPFHNPNQIRRTRPPHTVQHRETMSSETSEAFFKILKLPKISDEQEDGNEMGLEEDTPENKIKSPLNAKDVDENGSSEPEANQSPNQEPLIVNGQKERSPCPPTLEAVFLLSPTLRKGISSAEHLIVKNGVDIEVEDETCGNEEVSRLGNEQLCVPVAKPTMTEVSPSKGHLVDCGIQCTELQEPCSCREVMDDMETKRRHPFKYSDVKMANKGQDEGCGGHLQRNQKRHYQRRNKASEDYGRQQEAFSGYYGKSGKSRGDNHRT